MNLSAACSRQPEPLAPPLHAALILFGEAGKKGNAHRQVQVCDGAGEGIGAVRGLAVPADGGHLNFQSWHQEAAQRQVVVVGVRAAAAIARKGHARELLQACAAGELERCVDRRTRHLRLVACTSQHNPSTRECLQSVPAGAGCSCARVAGASWPRPMQGNSTERLTLPPHRIQVASINRCTIGCNKAAAAASQAAGWPS